MKVLDTEEVIDRAEKWARFHRKPETRGKMDTVLDGLSEADQRRVYLCGQRIAAGMSPKVIPPLNEKGKENETKHRAANRPAKGGKTAQAGSSVGTSPRPERQSKKGRDSKHEK